MRHTSWKSANRKVLNATECIADGIHFKSRLEMFCYLWFKSEGIVLNYESDTTKIEQEFSLTDRVKVWVGRKKANSRERYMGRCYKFQDMEYTPDFTFSTLNGEDIFYIETKGNPNDTYPIYKKLFLKRLCQIAEEMGYRFYFFEPHSKTEVQQTCEIIKSIIAENGRKESDIQRDIQHA